MVSRTTSLLDSLHTTKTVASYSTATEICASALSRNFAVEGGHNASKRDELAPLRSIVSSRQRAVNRFANSRVVMSARRTPPSGATCWRGQFNIRWVVLMEVRPLRWVLEGLREELCARVGSPWATLWLLRGIQSAPTVGDVAPRRTSLNSSHDVGGGHSRIVACNSRHKA